MLQAATAKLRRMETSQNEWQLDTIFVKSGVVVTQVPLPILLIHVL
jgi:hypothetical protein